MLNVLKSQSRHMRALMAALNCHSEGIMAPICARQGIVSLMASSGSFKTLGIGFPQDSHEMKSIVITGQAAAWVVNN